MFNVIDYLIKAKREGLIPIKLPVKNDDGKTFMRTYWVRRGIADKTSNKKIIRIHGNSDYDNAEEDDNRNIDKDINDKEKLKEILIKENYDKIEITKDDKEIATKGKFYDGVKLLQYLFTKGRTMETISSLSSDNRQLLSKAISVCYNIDALKEDLAKQQIKANDTVSQNVNLLKYLYPKLLPDNIDKEIKNYFLSSLKKLDKEDNTFEKNLKNSNPNYGKSKDYEINCQRCVWAYEMRCRGYDVEAKPNHLVKNLVPMYDLSNSHNWDRLCNERGQDITNWNSNKKEILKTIKEKMLKYGDGSRAILSVAWEKSNGSGHAFMVENNNGEIRYIDPQINNDNAEEYFDLVDYYAPIFMLRCDNVDLTSDIYLAVQNR